MKHVILNGADMTTRADAYAQLWRTLDCPEERGANLDALWDVVSTIDAHLTLKNPAPLLNGLGSYGCKMLGVLFKAADETEMFRFSVEA